MERISNKNPCLNCCSDRQIGNPDVWQSDCYRCEKLPNWKAKAINRFFDIEDILGDEYDLDRLKELVQADREGKCVVLPFKVGDTLYYIGGACEMLIKSATVEEMYIEDEVLVGGGCKWLDEVTDECTSPEGRLMCDTKTNNMWEL